MIVTICGSSKFKDKIEEVARDLTLQGHVVLTPCVYHHQEEEELPPEVKIRLDNIHRQKINLSEAIFVVNVDKYIGESTFGEIDWAERMEKKIYFLEQPEGIETEEAAVGDEPIEEIKEEVEPES